MSDTPIYAWHFSTGELDFDMKGTKVVAGLKVSMEEMPILKFKGFHGSPMALDALKFFSQRPNPNEDIVVSRVILSGEQITGDYTLSEDPADWPKTADEKKPWIPTNIVAQKREHLWIADAKSTVEAYGVWSYRENLRHLRNSGFEVPTRFDDALNAYIEKASNRFEIIDAALIEATAFEKIESLLERLAISLKLGLIEFVLANASLYTETPLSGFFDNREIIARKKKHSHDKLHEMLMELAPEGYAEKN